MAKIQPWRHVGSPQVMTSVKTFDFDKNFGFTQCSMLDNASFANLNIIWTFCITSFLKYQINWGSMAISISNICTLLTSLALRKTLFLGFWAEIKNILWPQNQVNENKCNKIHKRGSEVSCIIVSLYSAGRKWFRVVFGRRAIWKWSLCIAGCENKWIQQSVSHLPRLTLTLAAC